MLMTSLQVRDEATEKGYNATRLSQESGVAYGKCHAVLNGSVMSHEETLRKFTALFHPEYLAPAKESDSGAAGK
jgi:hypothetical protein